MNRYQKTANTKKKKYGASFFKKIGAKGGRTTAKRYFGK